MLAVADDALPSDAVIVIVAVPAATDVTVTAAHVGHPCPNGALTVATAAFDDEACSTDSPLAAVGELIWICAVWPAAVNCTNDGESTYAGGGVGVGTGVGVGAGVAVGTGVAVGAGVAVGTGVAVGFGVAVGAGDAVGSGVAVGTGDAVTTGVALGEGDGLGEAAGKRYTSSV